MISSNFFPTPPSSAILLCRTQPSPAMSVPLILMLQRRWVARLATSTMVAHWTTTKLQGVAEDHHHVERADFSPKPTTKTNPSNQISNKKASYHFTLRLRPGCSISAYTKCPKAVKNSKFLCKTFLKFWFSFYMVDVDDICFKMRIIMLNFRLDQP